MPTKHNLRTASLYSPLAILLLAALVFTPQLTGATRFHPDEALYMTFARDAAVGGNWLLTGELDKPPLTIYIGALSFAFFGVHSLPNGVLDLDMYRGEFAARLPNVWAAILLVALVMRLARDVGNLQTDVWAGLMTALSPYIIAFSATAFTDMQMVLWGTMATLWAYRRRAGPSGLALMLSIASKPQGVFYIPLTAALLWARGVLGWRTILRWVAPLLLGAIILGLWQTVRGGVDVWTLARAHYITPHLATLEEAQARLGAWLGYAQFLTTNAPTTALLSAITLLLWLRIPTYIASISAKIITLWILVYSLFHILITVNIYDRYLLPLAPFFALVSALVITSLISKKGALYALIGFALWLIGAIAPIGVGGDRGQHNGIDQLATYLNSKPIATVIYDTWLGWELGYYMGQWHDKRRVHYPTPSSLADGARALDERGTRYWVAPRAINATPWLRALRAVGFTTMLDWQSERFVVYRLEPPSLHSCGRLGLQVSIGRPIPCEI